MTYPYTDGPKTLVHADGAVEYGNRLELNRGGTICTHLPMSDVNQFINGFLGKGLSAFFDIKQCKLEKGSRAWYSFTLHRCGERMHDKRVIGDLLRYLLLLEYPMIWKQDRWGYEINMWGDIRRKWDLQDPNVPF